MFLNSIDIEKVVLSEVSEAGRRKHNRVKTIVREWACPENYNLLFSSYLRSSRIVGKVLALLLNTKSRGAGILPIGEQERIVSKLNFIVL